MPVNPIITSWLRDAELDLDAARRLAQPPLNRFCAFHLEQAAEKIVKALRLAWKLPATAGHDIGTLADELPDDEPLKVALSALDAYSAFATAYRYPSATGRVRDELTAEQVRAHADDLARLVLDARARVEAMSRS